MQKFDGACSALCQKCKIDCCKNFEIFLSEYDKERFRKFRPAHNLFNGNTFNTKGGHCPFYHSRQQKCQARAYRPLDCRIYPYSFWFEHGRVELWLDPKCPLVKTLAGDKTFYKEALAIAKKELFHWSEGEIFDYLIAHFDIEKFKRQVQGGRKKPHYKK